MNPETLERIGLTHNESLVYLTLLQIGTSRAGTILKRSRINSGKIYEIFESLKSKGLISESAIDGVRHFTAAPPQQLLAYVALKKREVQEEEDAVNTALPGLERLRNSALIESHAMTYTGLRGMQTAAEEGLASMKPGDELCVMGITHQKEEQINQYWKRFAQQRASRKIKGRHIFSERSSYHDTFRRMPYTEARVVTSITPAAVDIFGEHAVLLLSYGKEPSCILIYDKNIAISFRQFFEQMWKIAK